MSTISVEDLFPEDNGYENYDKSGVTGSEVGET
jgi:hypothetical protein